MTTWIPPFSMKRRELSFELLSDSFIFQKTLQLSEYSLDCVCVQRVIFHKWQWQSRLTQEICVLQGLYLEAIVSLSLEILCSLLDPYPELANDYLGLCVLFFGGEGKIKKSSSKHLQSALVLRSVYSSYFVFPTHSEWIETDSQELWGWKNSRSRLE